MERIVLWIVTNEWSMATSEHVKMPARHIYGYLKRNYGWLMMVGIILTVLGLLAIAYMTAATIVSVVLFGIGMMAAGVIQVVEAFGIRKWGGVFLHVILGLLYFITGLIMFVYPGMGAMFLTVMLSAFFVLVGFIRVVASVSMRFRQWGWTLISGLISILAGIALYLTLPVSGAWVIGFFLGIDLLFYGISLLAFGIGVKRREEYIEI